MKLIHLIDIKTIKQHEAVDKNNLDHVCQQIQSSGVFTEPIIIDKMTHIILDGHHRFTSCKQLGLTRIPCILVDYLHDKRIRVTTRRKEFYITKQTVIAMGISHNVFPSKTTKHSIPHRIKHIAIPLSKLR